MNILAIETSCDETSVAVLQPSGLTHITASQIDVHRATGGIVPEVAAREHVQVMAPLVEQALEEAGLKGQELDRIAVTAGPGLITSLMVGVETARTLGYVWKVPVFPINHIEGHIAANWIRITDFTDGIDFADNRIQDIQFPAIGLVVSGGHTELLYMKEPGSYELIGATRDDAAGECFDKCARILGLNYPGGPEISAQAAKGDATAYDFPRPMLTKASFEFSFSGLKTAVRYFQRDNPEAPLPDVCASLEQAIVDVLVKKTRRAVKEYKAKSVLVGGGVAANRLLRAQLQEIDADIHIPDPEFCTDNSAMIAAACLLHEAPTLPDGSSADLFSFKADPNWELTPR